MDNIDKSFVDMYGEIARRQGMDNLFCTLFARLYIDPEEVAMENLAKETGYSLASISNKIALMENMFPIRRVRKPGSKKIFLYIDKNIVDTFKNTLIKKEESIIAVTKEKLPNIIKEFRSKVKSEKDKKKLKILEDYYTQTIQLEIILKKFIESVDKLGH